MKNAQEHYQKVFAGMQKTDPKPIQDAVEVLKRARKKKSTVWVLGNGGSAATADHFANDLLKACKIPAIALQDLTAAITAFANDDGYAFALRHALNTLIRTNDVVVGISTSGNSPNIVKGMPEGYTTIAPRIAFVGPNTESKLVLAKPDVVLVAHADTIEAQEDLHMIMCHAIVRELKGS